MKSTRPTVHTRARHHTAPVHFGTSQRGLTSYAGLIPVIKFLDRKLHFTRLFQQHVGHERATNASYALADGVFLVLTALIGGARNLNKCAALWMDGVLRQAAGWQRVPGAAGTAANLGG